MKSPGVHSHQQLGSDNHEKTNRFKKWLKRIGIVGFLFFLIKGLIWLAIFFGIGKTIL